MARHVSTLSTRHTLHPELNPAEWVAVTARKRSAQTSDFTLSSLKDPPREMIGAASSGARPARSSGSPRPTIVIVCPLLLPYSWRSFSGLSLSCPVQILRTMDFMDSDGVIVEPEQLHVSQSELWPICQSELWHLQAVFVSPSSDNFIHCCVFDTFVLAHMPWAGFVYWVKKMVFFCPRFVQTGKGG